MRLVLEVLEPRRSCPPTRCRAESSWHRRAAPSALSQHFGLPSMLLRVSQLWAPNSPAGLEDTELRRVLDLAFGSV